MQTLAAGVSFIDLNFQQIPRIIATAVLHGPGGVALVDPGPSSTLPALRNTLAAAGIGPGDIRALLLTHIHLDHAGAAGTLVREHPGLRVYVHRNGAPHLVDPSKLLASAARLYGDDMDRLWGEVAAVPAEALDVLEGGERIEAGGRALDVAYTPGHASHHVSYLSVDTGTAFVGDTAGVRVVDGGYVLPATPPPDVDLEAWAASLALFESWPVETLFLTHFGPSRPVAAHISEFRDHLENMARLTRESLSRDGSDADREAWCADAWRTVLKRRMGERDAAVYEAAGRLDLSWRGLARYWKRRAT
jgi:glyoxylase-like metal-dependent hydrolase (beta-lactamase superfamily II)